MRKKSKQTLQIGIDLMGSDTDPALLLDAVCTLFSTLKNEASFTLFATEETLSTLSYPPAFHTCFADEVVAMDEDPLLALRRKKNSTIALGMMALKNKEIDAFISAGNTGALFATAHMLLPLLPSIDRPALLTLLPTKKKEMAVLDVGANVSCKADHLVQFALMGIAYQKCRGYEHPTVGLLNIGTEAQKGTPELREAYQKLQSLNTHHKVFLGNVEARDVFNGEIDVLVTDGFTGNIFLKTTEGIGAFLLDLLKEKKELLANLRHPLDYAEYPGALLCGVDGIVIKCHGSASPQSLTSSIKAALPLLQHNFLDKLKKELNTSI